MILLLSGCLTLDFMFFSGPSESTGPIEPELVDPANIEEVAFPTSDGLELRGAWAHQPDPEAPVLVYFHGKGGDIASNWNHRVEPLYALGYTVFVFDYRGYGASDGEQDGGGITEEDGLAALRYVTATTGKAPEELYWYALSLGGAVALHTTDDFPARAMVLESVFASADFMLDSSVLLDLPPAWFVEDDVDNVEAIRLAQAPVFVIHGLADDFVDPRSGRMLYDAAPPPRELWQPEGVGHADLVELLPDAFEERIPAFYDRY
ncbi:MAG: alpha/beta fold hydrolase [Alphaproteobacteria bacterium]|nr:alpha/beta fold hydrolase [Alphaproteobacteria bacterium]